MLTAGALLLEPDYTEVELIYSRDEYREAWVAMWRERQREGSGRDDSNKPAIGLVGNATCRGIGSDCRCIMKCCKNHLFVSEFLDENLRPSDVIATR